jgi:oxepin-CoA hydrolase/3-oxo-5,6-dehydrosuberyl-CoA semialdehyde dehydrogenase
MIAIPFDVNDNKLRASFFNHHLLDAIADLTEQTPPLWGNMTAQHMLEHLIWAFQCSTGTIVLACHTPENLLERAKRFLYDTRQTPHSFKNPELGENASSLLFSSFADTNTALRKELTHFLEHFRSQPGAVHVHPIFGPLGAEEWQRSHFKHCYHHLLQFGLIDQLGTAS